MSEPLPICHLDGAWLPLREARISPLDRGFLFGDGVYEVIPVYGGRPFRFAAHFDRLSRSLAAIRLQDPHDRAGWHDLVAELLRRNGADHASLYLQVTRGAEYGRNHSPFPQVPATVFAFCSPLPDPSPATLANGIAAVTTTDTRWSRCDIKSISLLANVLLRDEATQAGAQETILLRDGLLTEGSTSTAHIVMQGKLLTPPDSRWILPGTTRSVVEELTDRIGLTRETRAVTETELRNAEEIWIASSGRAVMPVTKLDGRAVGAGIPGPAWRKVWQAFLDYRRECATQPW
jgi:D-alanine transaminase